MTKAATLSTNSSTVLKLRKSVDFHLFELEQAGDELVSYDRLTNADWDTLTAIKALLKPLYLATKRLEGRKLNISTWLDEIEKLLEYYEQWTERSKRQPQPSKEVKQFAALVWAKLDFYYRVSDQTPAYTAARILNPNINWRGLQKRWKGRSGWLSSAQKRFEMLCKSYDTRSINTDVDVEPSIVTRAAQAVQSQANVLVTENPFDDDLLFSDDYVPSEPDTETLAQELDRYYTTPKVPWRDGITIDRATGKRKVVKDPIDLINWWRDNKERFPTLHKVALDIFAAPAMSSDLERRFSEASKTCTSSRSSLLGSTLERNQVLRSLIQEGMVGERRVANMAETECSNIDSDDSEDSN